MDAKEKGILIQEDRNCISYILREEEGLDERSDSEIFEELAQTLEPPPTREARERRREMIQTSAPKEILLMNKDMNNARDSPD